MSKFDLLDPKNATLIFIDHQSQMSFGVDHACIVVYQAPARKA